MYIHCIYEKNIVLSLFKIDIYIKLHHVYLNNFDMVFKNIPLTEKQTKV